VLDVGSIVRMLMSGDVQRMTQDRQTEFAEMLLTALPKANTAVTPVEPVVKAVEALPPPLQAPEPAPEDHRIYYHVTNLPGFQEMAREQIGLMYTSGLLAQSQLYINLHYSIGDYQEFRQEWSQHPLADRIHWVYAPAGPEEREHTTARLMWAHAQGTQAEYNILYVHQKGISYRGLEREFVTRDWQRYMDYWTIAQWQECVTALADPGADACGCNWREHPFPHYSGNQYWVRSGFLRNCVPLRLPLEVGYQSQTDHVSPYTDDYKFDVEAWIGHCGAGAHNLWESGRDHYWQSYPAEEYLLRVSKSNVAPAQG